MRLISLVGASEAEIGIAARTRRETQLEREPGAMDHSAPTWRREGSGHGLSTVVLEPQPSGPWISKASSFGSSQIAEQERRLFSAPNERGRNS